MWSFLRLALGRNRDASGTADPQRREDCGNKMVVPLQSREGGGMRPATGNIATYFKIFLPKRNSNMRESDSRFQVSRLFSSSFCSYHTLDSIYSPLFSLSFPGEFESVPDVQWSTHAEDLLHTWTQIRGRKKLLHGLEIRKDSLALTALY